MARKRNNTPLTEVQAKLSGDFIPLMRGMAAEFVRKKLWHNFDDLVSEGHMILVLAARGYDTSCGWTYEAYVREAIKNGFFRHIREERRKGKEKWDGGKKISLTPTCDNVDSVPTLPYKSTSMETSLKVRKTSTKTYTKPTFTAISYIDPNTCYLAESPYSEEERAHFRLDLPAQLNQLTSCILLENALSAITVMTALLMTRLSLPSIVVIYPDINSLWINMEAGNLPALQKALRKGLEAYNEGINNSISIKDFQKLTQKTYQSLLWAITHDKVTAFKNGSQWRVNIRDARSYTMNMKPLELVKKISEDTPELPGNVSSIPENV